MIDFRDVKARLAARRGQALSAGVDADIAALVAEVEHLRADNARIMREAERHRRIADEAIERIESADNERAAVVAYLRSEIDDDDDNSACVLTYAANAIERGAHRREGEEG
jgi:hypothetical protein